MNRMACVLALAGGTGIAYGAAAYPATAEVAPANSGLQLSVAALDSDPTDATLTLKVNFRGANIQSIALYMDGKQIDQEAIITKKGKGVIHFKLDRTLLAQGSHDVEVRAKDVQGDESSATAHIFIVDKNNGGGLAHFVTPKNNTMVQGVVPLEIKLDSALHNAYASFLLDGNFLALTNFAPYTYNWDTARVPNGVHRIEVEIYDGDTLATIKTLSLQVTVNNPGGFTHTQQETPDLRHGEHLGGSAALRTMTRIAKETAQSAEPSGRIDPQMSVSGLARTVREAIAGHGLRSSGAPVGTLGGSAIAHSVETPKAPAASPVQGVYSLRSAPAVYESHTNISPIASLADILRVPAAKGIPEHDLRAAQPGLPAIAKPTTVATARTPVPPASLAPPAPTAPPTGPAWLSPPAEVEALPAFRPMAGRLAHQPIGPHRTGNIAARPGLRLPVTRPAALPPAQGRIVPPPTLPMRRRSTDVPVASDNRKREMQIVFDDSPIAFDVPPRVERGVPFAPFRQIFEHTGGVVQWFGKSQTVHAFNSRSEIELHIGALEALVNNQPLKLESKPYLDRGRTIVPVSFVRDALDVSVQYDPATGHLRIESKK